MAQNIFLVEKRSSLKKHRPSMGLARLSTVHKAAGDTIYHIILDARYTLPSVKPDKVYISMIFSYDLAVFAKFVRQIRKLYPHLGQEDIVIGGVATLHMNERIEQEIGITPVVGCDRELDEVKPDPEFYDCDSTYVFTRRGCPQKCSFCVVGEIESEPRNIANWKSHIDMTKPNVVICDNNILASPKEHQKEVFDYLREIAPVEGAKVEGGRKLRSANFDGGIDHRLINDNTMEMLKGIRFNRIRLAWDVLGTEPQFDRAMQKLLTLFPQTSSRGLHEMFEVYVLYNCDKTKDSLEATLYRVYKLLYHYRVLPYLMRYQPLNEESYKTYISPYWDEKDVVDIARWINSRPVLMSTPSYKYYYGRNEDGKCINSTTQEERHILKVLEMNPPKLDYTKGFKDNLSAIRAEINARNKVLSQIRSVISEQMAMTFTKEMAQASGV